MASLNSLLNHLIPICVSTLLLSIGYGARASDHTQENRATLFIFGDSFVDSGNNNYITTIPENQAHYKPYGQNGFFDKPTGRFSDGRIVVDYIAEYAKLPLIPPFLQPSADYTNGVNFASGGAGVLTETNQGLVAGALTETNQGLVIELQKQLKNFGEVEKWLAEKLGEEKAKEVISEAVYFISIGSNDYMGSYLRSPKMQEQYNPEQYVGMVIGNLTQAVQVLYAKGARKFAFLSLSPLGCLPAFRSIEHSAGGSGCFEAASALALAHNNALKQVLTSLEQVLNQFKYSNSKFYDWLLEKIDNPTKYGFKDGVNACCGTGPYGGTNTCGGTKDLKIYEVCENADEFVWWDSFHPTERIHELLAMGLWSGPPSYVGPYNLQQLFSSNNKKNLTIGDVVDNLKEEIIFTSQF